MYKNKLQNSVLFYLTRTYVRDSANKYDSEEYTMFMCEILARLLRYRLLVVYFYGLWKYESKLQYKQIGI